jgi:hypothetical protein
MTNTAEKLQNSETTGFRHLALVQPNSTGTQLSEIGCGKRLKVSAALADLKPADTDHRVETSLERISGRRLALLTRSMFPSDGPAYSVVSEVRWDCPKECLPEAAAVIEGAFRAAPEDRIASALFKLRIMTRAREQRTEEMQEAEATIWIEQLRGYPGDIVLDVLTNWPKRKNGQWWPTWHEVEAELTSRADRRQAILNRLREIERKPSGPAIEHQMPTPEQRAAAVEHWENVVRPTLGATELPPPQETPQEALERLKAEGLGPVIVIGHGLAAKFEQMKTRN